MKIPRFPKRVPKSEPLRRVTVDHLHCSKPKTVGLFKKTTICDYESPEGIVREYSQPGKFPTYKLLKTGEEIRVDFSFTFMQDLDEYADHMY